MKINSIKIKNFRNIDNLECDFDDVNIIWGENAQGKTNLIEALYLFTGAKSFRGVKDSQLVKIGEKESVINIDFECHDRNQNAEIKIDKKREASLNGIKKTSPVKLGEEIKAVIFSPVHLNMIKDGPAERRRFVDMALCQLKSNYKNLLREYNRALNQRNTLLKDLYKNPELDSMLYIWNQNCINAGAKIIYQRKKYLETLTPFVSEIFEGISGGKEKIELKYVSAFDNEESIEENYLKALNETKVVDLQNKTTSIGPHRDDIEILINGNSARIYGSQGQQRSSVLAIKLAEASLLEQMTGIKPVALLDDVMSELDEKRQDYILNRIKNAQVFITCCDKEQILRLKQGKTINIKNGKIV